MKHAQTHIIKSQRYEITLDHKEEAYAYQSKVSRLQEHRIQHVLQNVMDRFDNIEYLDQFDEVVLDLGSISSTGFERELEYRVEEALTNFFRSSSYEGGALKMGKRKKLYDKRMEQFEFFLKNGYVEWNTSMSDKPIELFKTLLQKNKKGLVDLLKGLGRKESIRKRLITQLDDEFLEHIVLATVGNEATHINQYRKHIVDQQKGYKLIEVGSGSFRNAIWEITLAYIFIEVRSYSNQKNFLQYLIRKIAQKYRLTYKSLLHMMVLGVKSRQNKESRIIDFEKLLIMLQEEEEAYVKAVFDFEFEENNPLKFIELLKHYLTYNSLPANNKWESYKVFYKNIETHIMQNSTAFYVFFDAHIVDVEYVDLWIDRFPDSVLNHIVVKSPNKTLRAFALFLKQIGALANRENITSSTLQTAEKRLGEICLKAYLMRSNTPVNNLIAFLNAIIEHTEIDKAFVKVLDMFEHKISLNNQETLRAYIREMSMVYAGEYFRPKSLHIEPSILKLSKKIYLEHHKGHTITLLEFQQFLQSIDIKEVSLQVVLLLLNVCTSTKGYSKRDIVQWVEERKKELSDKAEPVDLIMSQLEHIMDKLGVDGVIKEGIKEGVKKTYHLSEVKNKLDKSISNPILYALIERIYEQFHKRTGSRLTQSVSQLIEAFSKKHGMSRKLVLSQLQDQIPYGEDYNILKGILKDQEFYKNATVASKKSRTYKRDVVQYVCIHGKLPWWNHGESIKELRDYFAEVIAAFPDHFKTWFLDAKGQGKLIRFIEDPAYEILIKQMCPALSTSIITIKTIIDDLIEKSISGIRSVSSQQKYDIRCVILNEIHKDQGISAVALTSHLIEYMAKTYRLDALDIKVLIWEKLNDVDAKSRLAKDVSQWLSNALKSNLNAAKTLTKLEQLTSYKKDWEQVFNGTSKKEVLPVLKAISVKTPKALYFYLKRTSFRKQIIEWLDHKEHIEFIRCFLSEAEQSRFSNILILLEKLRKQFSGSQYQIVWKHVVEFTLLKIAMDKPKQWITKDWSVILYKSISQFPETIVSGAFRVDALNISNDTTEIIQDVEHLMNNDEEQIKNDAAVIEEKEEVIGESIYVSNAGMVILSPFIPMLFERLGLLEDGKFKDDSSAQKAVHVLQYAVTGKEGAEEQNLALNKIICGMSIQDTIEKHIAITPEEKELVESLLKAVIAQWSTIGNTSVEGLRETFLCRDGSLNIEEDSYTLSVEEKTFDMLLDHIPWGIGTLKLSWMQKLIHVIWRN